jgi:amino acid adenylation domain-containing protein
MAKLSHFDGDVDVDLLVTAFATVVTASDTLGCRIVEEGGAPLMVPADTAPVTEVIDVARSTAPAWADERVRTPVDPSRRPYDSVVLRHEDGTTSWYLSLHHLVTDAASSALVFAATAAAYHDETFELAPYTGWVETVGADTSPRIERAIAHWRDRPEAPTVARLYQPVRSPETRSSRVPVGLDPNLRDSLAAGIGGDYRQMTDELAWTSLLMTATAVLMHKVARVDEFAIGLPIHNRSGARQVIGTVMEVFPVDVAVEPDDTFRSLHRRVTKSVMTTMRHAAPGHAPNGDYEAVVNVIPAVELGPFGPIPVDHSAVDSEAIDAGHLVRVQMNAYGEAGFGLVLDMNHGSADRPARRRAGAHMASILRAMVTDPDTAVASFDIRTGQERSVQDAWETAPDLDGSSVDMVPWLQSALADRDDVAIEDATVTLTGRELWRRVGHVAGWLTERGAAKGRRVGIEMGRSVDTVVAMLATLVAGASYVPLDPRQPRRRLDALIERADCVTVVTAVPEIPAGPPEVHFDPPAPGDEAYLLFTSGSTGEPKGVPISHLGLSRYIAFAADNYVIDDTPPVVALFSALTFDLTVTSVFTPLVTGGRTVVIEADGGAGLAAIADRSDITWAKATPSHLEVLTRVVDETHGLRTLVVGGEAFGSNLAKRLGSTLPGVRIFNEYGPTEAVVGCMIHESTSDELARWAEVPIGGPAPGVSLSVRDESLNRVPLGAQGELCISHVGLTSGYLGTDPSQPESPFVTIDGRRWYRSGDLVRMADDATLVYLGRIDEQVKVGGIRLEPLEVADALERHPSIGRAAVRLWSPTATAPDQHCIRCGLPSNVPGSSFDDAGVCSMCHSYDRIAPTAASWFKTRDDLTEWAHLAHERRTGDYDCLHLLSGGKDSTYALYQLVEMGFRPYALTLDNGFISEGAKDNVRRSVADLGIDHEFATHESMNDIFRDSLDRYSNVCHGCYKTIYTLATTRAVELGIPVIVTGLSRGQLFETRLIPQQFADERFDADAIDRAVIEARKAYHRIDDGTNRLLDTAVFEDDSVFDDVAYLDFYRYVDVELAEMLDYLDRQAPWVRPTDTGRSTNCLVNAAGIHTHLTEQGYHNYAEPYAWDVRLGHKTRDEAMEELDDQLDLADVGAMLSEIRYEPRQRETLVAWLEPASVGGVLPTPAELRSFLGDLLPAHAIPAAFVSVDQIPMTTNGKLDTTALRGPDRVHRVGSAIHVSADTEAERHVVATWEHVLGVEPIGVDDDFFALGGDSLAAMQMIVALSERVGWAIPEDFPFLHTTPRELASALDTVPGDVGEAVVEQGLPVARPAGAAPPVSAGEQAILFDQQVHPADSRYNVGRVHRVHGTLDTERFVDALQRVVMHHAPMHWTHGSTRRKLPPAGALEVQVRAQSVAPDGLEAALSDVHRRPFDLADGPLVRCVVQPVSDGSVAVLLAFHHVCGDAESFDRIWRHVDTLYQGGELPDIPVDYADVMASQAAVISQRDRDHWVTLRERSARVNVHTLAQRGPDGFVKRVAGISPAQLNALPGVSGFATALAAVAGVIRRRADGNQVGIGVIASTRDHEVTDDLVGYFLNTLPFDVVCDLDTEGGDFAATVARQAAVALAHRGVPLAEIVAARRDAGQPPPNLDVLLAFDTLSPATLGGSRVDHHVMFNGTAVAGLVTFFVEVREDRVDLSMEFNGQRLNQARAEAMLEDLDVMLAAIVTKPRTLLAAVDLPSDGTSELVGPAFNPSDSLMPALLRHMHESSGSAVRCGEQTLSWTELGARSAAISAALLAEGVVPGDRVLVAMGRSVDLVAGIVAILRIGASYVPIDLGYPAERIAATVVASGAQVVIVGGLAHEAVLGDARLVKVEAVTAPAAHDVRAIDMPVNGGHEAYVIFTSGSTGRPRGVPVLHRNLAASTEARALAYDQTPETFLVVSSPAFDSSIAGLFWALGTGGCVVLPTEREAHDPEALTTLLGSGTISHTLLVPTLYAAVLDRGAVMPGWPAQVIVAGEACSPGLVHRHHALRSDSRLANEYGPTECTVWATVHHCTPADQVVPIGPPIAGGWVGVVTDEDLRVPAGIEGQLVIGGTGVVNGYLDDESATASRFGIDERGRRFFRTGDRAVVRDGTVVFLGRADHQLNVGGVRAEPEEIERVLGGDDAVAAVIVVAADPRSLPELMEAADPAELGVAMARASTAADPSVALAEALREFADGEPELVAHVEPAPGRTVDVAVLRSLASLGLPAVLRPRRFVVHDALPKSPTGKIDRPAVGRLVALDGPPVAGPVPTSSDTDRDVATLADLFAEVLGIQVGADESFFDLGGHSLLALQLVDRIQARFDTEFGVADMYDAPTPRDVAQRLGVSSSVRGVAEYVVPIQPNGERPPLFGVHVLGVNAEYYRPLAERLGEDQPLYGLGLATSLADATAPTGVAEIASLYADELERVAPKGPVLLAAVSLGAVVAFELARRLRARGRDVALLALFDAAGPDVAMAPERRNRVLAHAAQVRANPARYVNERRLNLTLRALRTTEVTELAVRERAGLDLPDRLRIRRFIEANALAAIEHHTAPYDGRVAVFKAEVDPFGWARHDARLGWGSVALGGLEIVPVPGEHLSMLADPHVADLADALRGTIDRAVAQSGPSQLSIDLVEAQLCHALATGSFAATVEGLLRRDDLTPDGRSLVERADATLRSIADHVAMVASDVSDTFVKADVAATVNPPPSRAEHASLTVRVDADPLGAVRALEQAGYRPQSPMSPGAWRMHVRTASSITLIALDDATTRVTLGWDGPTRRGALTPNPADYASLGLPAFAWPLYWLVRPIRLMVDRIAGRTGGGDLGPFLGTRTSMVEPVLRQADIGPDDVLLDIGCGDGRVLIEAVGAYGCRARGVERDPTLAEIARARVDAAGMSDRIEIECGDAADVDFVEVTVAFAFLPAEAASNLLPRLLGELATGARVLAHEQVVGDWLVPPTQSRLIVDGGITVSNLWLVP